MARLAESAPSAHLDTIRRRADTRRRQLRARVLAGFSALVVVTGLATGVGVAASGSGQPAQAACKLGPDAQCAHARLVRANLERRDLHAADLAGANVSKADLAGANMSGDDLAGANASGANLSGADVAGADLAGADLAGADLTSANLSGSDLNGARLAGARLCHTIMATGQVDNSGCSASTAV